MNRACLCVNLDSNEEHISDFKVELTSFEGEIFAAHTKERSLAYIEDKNLIALIIFTNQWTQEIDSVLHSFQQAANPNPEHIFVVSLENDPSVMKGCFEYGVEQFFGAEGWQESVSNIITSELLPTIEQDSVQLKLQQVGQALKTADQKEIGELSKELEEASKYDYVAAIARGKLLEATGSYEDAEESFKSGEKLNRTYVPAIQSLCETLIVLGKTEEAIPRLEKLEKMNKNSFQRKVLLSQAHTKTGDLEKAKTYLSEAGLIAPDDPKLKEAEVAYLISNNQIGEAMKKLDETENIGHYLASKLNEIGVRFSQNNQSEKALVIYQKAHRAVRKELKHKISLNAGIACYRAKKYSESMKFLQRSKAEYGSAYPKLIRVANSVKKAMAEGGKS